MDEIELSKLFVEYASLWKRLEELRKQIEKAILELGETRKIAGVTALYYKPGFETPDYEGAARAVMPEDFDLSPYSKTTVFVSWKDVCEALNVTPPPGAARPARVVVKCQ